MRRIRFMHLVLDLDSLFQCEFDRILIVRRHHDVGHPVEINLLQNVLQTPYRRRSRLIKDSINDSDGRIKEINPEIFSFVCCNKSKQVMTHIRNMTLTGKTAGVFGVG